MLPPVTPPALGNLLVVVVPPVCTGAGFTTGTGNPLDVTGEAVLVVPPRVVVPDVESFRVGPQNGRHPSPVGFSILVDLSIIGVDNSVVTKLLSNTPPTGVTLCLSCIAPQLPALEFPQPAAFINILTKYNVNYCAVDERILNPDYDQNQALQQSLLFSSCEEYINEYKKIFEEEQALESAE